MPEPYWPKKRNSYLISDAERSVRYARIWCGYCKREFYFPLKDLRVAYGNIECDDVVYQTRWRCSGCDNPGPLDMALKDPPAEGGVTIRRLVRVDYVRKPVWRDERI